MLAGTAHANFASDPTRKETPSFTRFFLKRFDKWFSANVADPRKGLGAKEVAFIDAFLKSAPAFGIKTENGFLRTVHYGVTIEGNVVKPGPFRFILAESQSALKPQILEIVKSKKISVAPETVIGIGFTGGSDELEVILKDDTLTFVPESMRKSITAKPVWVRQLHRAGKLVSSEVLEIDVDSKGPCPSSMSYAQIDRVTDEDGKTTLSCHTSQFEDQALAPAARNVGVKVRRGLNITPGAIEVSGTRVRLFYP